MSIVDKMNEAKENRKNFINQKKDSINKYNNKKDIYVKSRKILKILNFIICFCIGFVIPNTFYMLYGACLLCGGSILIKEIDKNLINMKDKYLKDCEYFDMKIDWYDRQIDAYYSVLEYDKGKTLTETDIAEINCRLGFDDEMLPIIEKINSKYKTEYYQEIIDLALESMVDENDFQNKEEIKQLVKKR